MMMDILKCPSREIEFTTFDDLNAKALAFAMDKEAYTQARALEATENGTTYCPIGLRLRRGTFIDTLCEVGAANISGFTTLTIGLFPEGLGQDIAT